MSTAWVLGTAPSLEIDRLPELEGEFTLGVNHILRSGFTPDALFWLDPIRKQMPDAWAQIERFQGLKVGPGGDFELKDWPGWGQGYFQYRATSGDTAVRWLLFMGFHRVVCLGVGTGFDGTQTNFYGEGKAGGRERAYVLARENLLKDFRGRVVFPEPGETWEGLKR